MNPPVASEGFPALSLRTRAGIVSLAVLQFLFGFGPVWRDLMHWNRAIAWSYASIPLMVIGALAWHRRLKLGPAFLHTLELCCVKFAVTGSTLLVLLSRSSVPNGPSVWQTAPITALGLSAGPAPVHMLRAPPPADSRALTGTVHGAEGQPASGAVVYVSAGLEPYQFPVPAQSVVLRNDGRGFAPFLAVAQVGQPLRLESSDGKLHSFRAERLDHRWVVNVPITGGVKPMTFDSAKGILQIRCTVHPSEAESFLGIFAHPFVALTDAQGHFAIAQVPNVPLTVSAFLPRTGQASISIGAGRGRDGLDLRLGATGRVEDPSTGL